MSLIQQIRSRSLHDCINEGAKVALTGSVALVSDSSIYDFPDSRAGIVTGFTLTSSSATATLTSLGWRNGSTTVSFWSGYVSSGSPIVMQYQLGDWYRGGIGYNLVITTGGAGPVAYTIDMRVVAENTPLGYVPQLGGVDHNYRAQLPPESGLDRGQTEV